MNFEMLDVWKGWGSEWRVSMIGKGERRLVGFDLTMSKDEGRRWVKVVRRLENSRGRGHGLGARRDIGG